MKNVLIFALSVALLIGGYYAYQNLVIDNSIHILESVQHELAATEEFVFSRDKLSFTKTENRKKLLAHINYLFTWDASVPFGFSSKDIQLDYDKSNEVLKVTVNNLRLYPIVYQ